MSAGARPDQVTDLDERDAPGEEGEEGSGDAQQRNGAAASAFLRAGDESAAAYAARIFRRVFCEDIRGVLSMEVCALGPAGCAHIRLRLSTTHSRHNACMSRRIMLA